MDTKKIVLVSVILMIAISSLSMVSAGWFDFGGSGKEDTSLGVYGHDKSWGIDGNLTVGLLHKLKEPSTTTTTTKNGGQSSTTKNAELLANRTIEVNVTDKNGNTNSYNVTSGEDYVYVCSLAPGEYNVSAIFKGDNEYNFCNLTKVIKIKEPISESDEGGVKTQVYSLY